jgi:outer membrane receptor protein involved in Fe transport
MVAASSGIRAEISPTNAADPEWMRRGWHNDSRVPMRGPGGFSNRASLYWAKLVTKLAGLELTSISGYGITKHSASADLTSASGGLAQSLYGVSGSSLVTDTETGKFSQELRLSSSGGRPFEWMVGAFYTHEGTTILSNLLANDHSTGSPAGVFFDTSSSVPYSEYALFGDLTVHFTDRFNVQFGARKSRIRQRYDETDAGPLYGPSPVISPTEYPKGSPFRYLVTPQLEFSFHLMVYARLASGYRTGGPNPDAVFENVRPTYDPDKTYNYELGINGDLWSRALSFDASVYYIDWKHIQILVTDPTTLFGYYANAGNAKSQGIELSVQARPIRGLTLATTASVNDAELTQNFPPISNAFGYAASWSVRMVSPRKLQLTAVPIVVVAFDKGRYHRTGRCRAHGIDAGL